MPEAFNEPGEGETPSARYRPNLGMLDFYGKAIWANESDFFGNFNDWAKEFFDSNDADQLIVEFHLERIKSHALNDLREFLLLLAKEAQPKGKTIFLRWDTRGDVSVENSVNLLRAIIPDIRASVGMPEDAFTYEFIPTSDVD